PQTPFGQFLSAIVMIIGYGIIAVPTGIVSAELAQAMRMKQPNTVQNFTRSCKSCGGESHDLDAVYCQYCAATLDADE
ncbi:MAG: ion transporter, partial [Leptospirales bacterium]